MCEKQCLLLFSSFTLSFISKHSIWHLKTLNMVERIQMYSGSYRNMEKQLHPIKYVLFQHDSDMEQEIRSTFILNQL